MRECIENDWLPYSLRIGVPYELFGKLNPKRIKPFEKAYMENSKQEQRERLEYLNVGAWLNGIYVAKAIASCFSKNEKYPEKPIDFNIGSSKEVSEKSLDENAANFREYAIAFNIQRRKKLQESGAEINARS